MLSNARNGFYLIIVIIFCLFTVFAIVKFDNNNSNRENLNKKSGAIVWLVESGSRSLWSIFYRLVFFPSTVNQPQLFSETSTGEIRSSNDSISETELLNDEAVMSPTGLKLKRTQCLQEGLSLKSKDHLDSSEGQKFTWKNWNLINILAINWHCLWQEYWGRQSGWLSNK